MGASRSVMLHPPSSPHPRQFEVAPNRVLPSPPAARLRPTHNGNALHARGTIRGSRQKQGRFSQQHRLFHSDPNIARGRGSDNQGRDVTDKGRVNGGMASERKCRQKKKNRAPPPPACRCKTRAPAPPPAPPTTEGATTRTASSWESAGGFEKKVPPLEKWRHCRSAGDVKTDAAGAFDSPVQQRILQPPKFYFGADGQGESPLRRFPVCRRPADNQVRLRSLLSGRPLESSAAWHCSSSDSEDEGRPCDWTPRQDLSDDGSDDEVTRPLAAEIRFPLPALVFSNRRPLGHGDAHWASGRGAVSKGVTSDSNWASEPGVGDVALDSNWTFGLQKHGRQYSSELLLSSKKRSELLNDRFGEFLLGDVLVSKAGQMKTSGFGQTKKSSDSGHSNFSFYSTDGRVAPTEPPRGRVSEIRRRFDVKLSSNGQSKQEDFRRRRNLQLARMLEDEVRKRRNREKAGLREELRRLKRRMDEDDEAYFTEPFADESLVTLGQWRSEAALTHAPVSVPWSCSSSPSPPPMWLGDEERGRGQEGSRRSRGERGRGDSVYKRLMDIVRKEERNLDAQRVSSATPSSCSGDSREKGSQVGGRQDCIPAALLALQARAVRTTHSRPEEGRTGDQLRSDSEREGPPFRHSLLPNI